MVPLSSQTEPASLSNKEAQFPTASAGNALTQNNWGVPLTVDGPQEADSRIVPNNVTLVFRRIVATKVIFSG
jgi:hypothetical protein